MANYEEARARLVEKWTTASRHTTADVLSLGQLVHVAIRAKLKGVQDAGARKAARADVVKDLRVALTDVGCDRAAELQRWVACWAVADTFGMEAARTLPLATLRAFVPLVRRDARHETWAARLTFKPFAVELWTNAGTMKSAAVAAAIRAKVGGSRKPRTVKVPDAAAALTKVAAAIDALPVEVQRQLLVALQRRFQPTPAAVPVVPVEVQRQPVAPDRPAHVPQAQPTPAVSRIDAPAQAQPHLPPRTAAPVEKPAGIFASWGRKAG